MAAAGSGLGASRPDDSGCIAAGCSIRVSGALVGRLENLNASYRPSFDGEIQLTWLPDSNQAAEQVLEKAGMN